MPTDRSKADAQQISRFFSDSNSDSTDRAISDISSNSSDAQEAIPLTKKPRLPSSISSTNTSSDDAVSETDIEDTSESDVSNHESIDEASYSHDNENSKPFLADFIELEPTNPQTEQKKDSAFTKVLLTGLSWSAGEEEIKDFCSTFGKLKFDLFYYVVNH